MQKPYNFKINFEDLLTLPNMFSIGSHLKCMI